MNSIYIQNYPPLLNDDGHGIAVNYEEEYLNNLEHLLQADQITSTPSENRNGTDYIFKYQTLEDLIPQIENTNLKSSLQDVIKNIKKVPQTGG